MMLWLATSLHDVGWVSRESLASFLPFMGNLLPSFGISCISRLTLPHRYAPSPITYLKEAAYTKSGIGAKKRTIFARGAHITLRFVYPNLLPILHSLRQLQPHFVE
jgi:hypothetical protein